MVKLIQSEGPDVPRDKRGKLIKTSIGGRGKHLDKHPGN